MEKITASTFFISFIVVNSPFLFSYYYNVLKRTFVPHNQKNNFFSNNIIHRNNQNVNTHLKIIYGYRKVFIFSCNLHKIIKIGIDKNEKTWYNEIYKMQAN